MNLNPLLWVLIIGVAFVAMTILISLLMSICVALAGHRYSDKLQTQYQKKLRAMLPGKDCGACGCENCDGFARAVLFGAVAEDACPHADGQVPQKLVAAVADMRKRMEDPRPPEERKNRLLTLWQKKQ